MRLCGGLVGGAHLETGATSGLYLYSSSNRLLARPAFGLDAQLAWLPIRSLVIGLGITGLVLPLAASWEIQGLTNASRSLPLFEGLIRLSFAFGANR